MSQIGQLVSEAKNYLRPAKRRVERGVALFRNLSQDLSYRMAKANYMDADPQSLILNIHPGQQNAKSRNLCLFAHYDPDGFIEPYVVYHLEQLREQLEVDIIFVSTSEKLIQNEEFQAVLKNCHTLIQRQNVGLDFGSWKVALDYLGSDTVAKYDALYFTNDSIYGPTQSLDGLKNKMKSEHPTLVGITESWEVQYHLQSYFLAFNAPAVQHPAFSAFWDNFVFFKNRLVIIKEYEIGVSRYFLKHGFRLSPLWKYSELRDIFVESTTEPDPVFYSKVVGCNANPTHYLWRELLTRVKSPYIKADLLKYNYEDIPGLHDFRKLLGENSEYDEKLIHRHTQRVGNFPFL